MKQPKLYLYVWPDFGNGGFAMSIAPDQELAEWQVARQLGRGLRQNELGQAYSHRVGHKTTRIAYVKEGTK